MHGIKELDVLQLHGMMQERGVALIDVRTPAEENYLLIKYISRFKSNMVDAQWIWSINSSV